MLRLSSSLLQQPVLSLQSGTPVATVASPIINPDNLKIEGFFCHDNRTAEVLVLLYQDIREVIGQGMVVNDYETLAHPEDLVRLHHLMNIGFDPIGKHVETITKHRVGKVIDYATEIETMYIQKIYVAQSFLKHFAGGNLGIDRSQIQEITDKKIIVQDLLKTAKAAPAAA